MFGMPSATPYDLNFRLLGIPVRVHPLFWLIAFLLSPDKEPRDAILWIGCVFLSILVHEYGHGLMAKGFGYRPMIALYGMGGLCASESERQTPGQRLAVLFAGPGSQLVLLGLLMLLGNLLLGISWQGNITIAGNLLGIGEGGRVLMSPRVDLGPSLDLFRSLYIDLFYINLVWPLLNLLPIWPLDGGQITTVLLSRYNRRHGARWSHIVSMATAGLLAFYVLGRLGRSMNGDGLLLALFFGGFALVNYQMLQAYHYRYQEHGYDDEADWWKR